MARALWLLALLSAFFVAAVRCLSGSVSSCASASGTSSTETRALSGDSDDEDGQAAPADLDDDSDDNAEPLPALAAASPVRLLTFADQQGTGLPCGALAAERPLPSHAPSLERPPRV